MANYKAYFTVTRTSSKAQFHNDEKCKLHFEFDYVTDNVGKKIPTITQIPKRGTHITSSLIIANAFADGASSFVTTGGDASKFFWGNYEGNTQIKYGGEKSQEASAWKNGFFSWVSGKTSFNLTLVVYRESGDEDDPFLLTIGESGTLVVQYTDYYAASSGELSSSVVDLNPSDPQSVYMTITSNCEAGYRNKVYHVINWTIPNAAFGNYSYRQQVNATSEETFTTESYTPPVSFLSDYMTSLDSVVMNVSLQTVLASDNSQIGNVQTFTITLRAAESLKPTFGADGESGLFYYRFHDAPLEYLLSHNNVFEEDIGLVQSHDGVSILIDNAAGIEGSTVTDFVYTVSGRTYTQHVGDPGFTTVVGRQAYVNAIRTGTEGTYANVYKIPLVTTGFDMTVNCYIVDSRGYKSVSKTIKIPVTAYSVPSITEASSIRCDAEGTALETGLYARASATASYSRLTVVDRDSQGNIVYSTDDEGNLIPNYRNLNTLEITVAFGEPAYDPGHVDEDGNPIPVWTWISPEDDVIGTPLSPTSGSKVVGDGVATHVTGIRFLANDYFTSQPEIEDQPMEIVFTTSSEYAIFFREGGTGVSFGQALSANEDNRFVVSSSWAMLHGDHYIPSVVISTVAPNFVPSSNSSMLWLKPDDTDTVGNWMGCKVYIYNP